MQTRTLVTLIDGQQVDSASEAWRHECEARHIANLATKPERDEYQAKVFERRGAKAGKALQDLAMTIYNAKKGGSQP